MTAAIVGLTLYGIWMTANNMDRSEVIKNLRREIVELKKSLSLERRTKFHKSNTPGYYDEKSGFSYDDVHNFDR